MFSERALVRVERLSKRYEIYGTPRDRLKQLLLPPLRGALRLAPKHYYAEFWALRDVSFEIAPGEAVGILGRNGSGKSTLLQLICGTLAPTSGTVQTRGRIGALLELGAGFNGDFTGRENVLLSGTLLGLEPEEIEARFDEIAAFADIGPFMEHAVKTYSSGMYVRLAFAVQACVEPAILVVDEALAVGDEKFQRKCYAHIDALRERGTAILLVTHSTATIEKYCDRAMLLNRGELHGIGAANQVVDQYHALLYADEQAYLRYLNGSQGAASVPVVSHAAAGAAASPLASDSSPSPSLSSSPSPSPSPASAAATAGNASPAAGAKHAAHPSSADGAGRATAVLSTWQVLDEDEQPRELFRVGERARIAFTVDVMQPVRELRAGLLIRTIEGVTAFGTSTGYHRANCFDAQPGQRLRIVFELHLRLCAGPYFVTIAVAEPMSNGDMRYLDRRTDILLLRVHELAVTGTGIASLPVRIETECLSVTA